MCMKDVHIVPYEECFPGLQVKAPFVGFKSLEKKKKSCD